MKSARLILLVSLLFLAGCAVPAGGGGSSAQPSTPTQAFAYIQTPVCFFGHTHFPYVYSEKDGNVEGTLLEGNANEVRLEKGVRYLINPGSVGQPRDRNPRAAFAVYDSETRVVKFSRVEYDIEKPGNKLQSASALDCDTLVSEVKRIRGRELPLTSAGVQRLRDEYSRTIKPTRALAAETLQLECALSDLVNQAYGLTPEEIALMWKTAPPRMPIPPPNP